MQLKQTKTENNTAFVEATIPQSELNVHKDAIINQLAPQTTVKGFRQGKAPKSLVAENVDPDKLTDKMLDRVLNLVVNQALKDFDIKLLGRPVLETIDTKQADGWLVNMTFPLYPSVELGDYHKFLKSPKAPKEEKEEDKLNKIYETLLKKIEIDVPSSVIDEEVNYSLNRLISQAKSLNLSPEAYLKAIGKSIESLKEEYATRAKDSLKLDLILLEIAKKEGITATEAEIEEFAKVSNVPASQHPQLKAVMERRKTIDFLLKL